MTPSPEHIDAVDALAQVIAAAEGFMWPDTEAARDVWREKTHAAMLDALTRHGVLTEEWAVRHAQGTHPGPFTEKSAREWIEGDRKHEEHRQLRARGRQALLRRLVTPWEVAR